MDDHNYSGYKFAQDYDDVSESKLTHLRSGRSEPSKEMILALMDKFPKIGYKWLLTGEGEPIKDKTKNMELEEPESNGSKLQDERRTRIINELEEKIKDNEMMISIIKKQMSHDISNDIPEDKSFKKYNNDIKKTET